MLLAATEKPKKIPWVCLSSRCLSDPFAALSVFVEVPVQFHPILLHRKASILSF